MQTLTHLPAASSSSACSDAASRTARTDVVSRSDRAAALARAAQAGMTLIEILVVIAIIGLVVGGISVAAFKKYEQAQVDTARNQTQQVAKMVQMYRMQRKKCPASVQDLKDSGEAERNAVDPWGTEYQITCPGADGRPADVVSAGPDTEFDTEDDIKSWEDGSEAANDE